MKSQVFPKSSEGSFSISHVPKVVSFSSFARAGSARSNTSVQSRKSYNSDGSESLDFVVTSNVGSCSDKSQRPENQDVIVNFVTTSGMFVAGVLDGHGKNGKVAAVEAARIFKEVIEESFTESLVDMLKETRILEGELQDEITELIVSCFQRVHERLKEEIAEKQSVNLRWSGTTATLAFILNKFLFVANVGDSDAYLMKRNGDLKLLSKAHRADQPEEKARVEAAGAIVDKKRIFMKEFRMPGLMVARTIGDFQAHSELGVSCVPSIAIVKISREDELLVIGSDGVWDYIDKQETVNLLQRVVCAQGATETLVEKAVQQQDARTADNTTAIVVILEDHDAREERIGKMPPLEEPKEESVKIEEPNPDVTEEEETQGNNEIHSPPENKGGCTIL